MLTIILLMVIFVAVDSVIMSVFVIKQHERISKNEGIQDQRYHDMRHELDIIRKTTERTEDICCLIPVGTNNDDVEDVLIRNEDYEDGCDDDACDIVFDEEEVE